MWDHLLAIGRRRRGGGAVKSPTQNSLKLLRKSGYSAQVVEHWNPFAHVRVDLFNWIDIVAVSPNQLLGVQTTTKAHIKERVQKAKGNKALAHWMLAGGRLVVHGWVKRKNRWELESYDLHMADIE